MATEVQARPAAHPQPRVHRLTGAFSGALDFVSDLALLGFAAWTVIYHVGLIFGIPTNPLLVVWVLGMLASAWYLRGGAGRSLGDVAGRFGGLDARLGAVAVVLGAASALLIFKGSAGMWWPGWLLGAASAALGLVAVLRRPADAAAAAAGEADRFRVSLSGTCLAVLCAVGLAVVAVFVVHADADDIFYVNRAAWVADHGTIPTKDTIYSSQGMSALSGAGVPVSSIETLQGAVAHVFGLAGGTVAYLVTPPVAVFLAVWALWRLIRAWAPRRRALCFAVAIVYLLWDAAETRSVGAFFILRMQQGKAIFASLLVPLLFVYLTKWVNRPTARTAVLLGAAGAAAVGFTSSATFIVPLICATVAIPLLLRRRFRSALGSLVPFVYPLIVGVVVHFSYGSGALDQIGVSYTGEQAFRLVVGPGWFGVISWLAVLCAIWLVRPGGARFATIGLAVVLLILTAPKVFSIMNALTGAHAVLWRSIWVAPLPAVVGLAASVKLPSGLRWAAPVPAGALAAAVILAGFPMWQQAATFTSRPTWRFPADQMNQAWAVIRADHTSGTVLAPYPTMQGIALATTRVHAVNPRDSYRGSIDESARRKQARYILARLTFGHVAPQPQVAAALRELNVGLVCLEPTWHQRRRYVQQAGYESIGRVGREICYRATG